MHGSAMASAGAMTSEFVRCGITVLTETGSISRVTRVSEPVMSAVSQRAQAGLRMSQVPALLHRTVGGVVPTAAGSAFYRLGHRSLRYADHAVLAA